VVNLDEARARRDREWTISLLQETCKNPDRELNPEDWKRLRQVDPFAYEGLQTSARIRKVEKQAGGDRARFNTLWKEELETIKQEEPQKQNEKEVTQRKLPEETSRDEVAARLKKLGFAPLTDAQWQERERMRTRDPASLTKEEWHQWRKSPASLTDEDITHIEELNEAREERQQVERKKREALGWGDELGDLSDGFYIDVILENAKKLGIDPHTLTPQQRKELRSYGRFLNDDERKLGRRLAPGAPGA
jgi:hypothetical protein